MTTTPKAKGADQTPAMISDHAFTPDRRGWWGLCCYVVGLTEDAAAAIYCGLAESAHTQTTVKRP